MVIINRFVFNINQMTLKKDKLYDFFTFQLMKWNVSSNHRKMPWKFEKDPYKIWLSEIILQQTRVEQGLEYYNSFVKKYPDVVKLAAAPEKDIFKLWEGLGYYSRCRNLIFTAKHIASHYKGKFPDTYNEILSLKGIGAYTAAAISSFAYNLPHAVVDGNVMRVISRFFSIETPIDSTEGKKLFSKLADKLLDKTNPALYNQAIMDFGATVCKPKSPICIECPLSKGCKAFKENSISSFPVKAKSIRKKTRYFYYVIAEFEKKFLINNRNSKDIWRNLNEFILFETEASVTINKLESSIKFKQMFGNGYLIEDVSETYRQQLTHQTIETVFIRILLKKPVAGFQSVTLKSIKKMAFPKVITSYFEKEKFFG